MPSLTELRLIISAGDVIYLKVPKLRILVLGSAEAAFDLLEKRSEIYSDRPPNIMNELFVILIYLT